MSKRSTRKRRHLIRSTYHYVTVNGVTMEVERISIGDVDVTGAIKSLTYVDRRTRRQKT